MSVNATSCHFWGKFLILMKKLENSVHWLSNSQLGLLSFFIVEVLQNRTKPKGHHHDVTEVGLPC